MGRMFFSKNSIPSLGTGGELSAARADVEPISSARDRGVIQRCGRILFPVRRVTTAPKCCCGSYHIPDASAIRPLAHTTRWCHSTYESRDECDELLAGLIRFKLRGRFFHGSTTTDLRDRPRLCSDTDGMSASGN